MENNKSIQLKREVGVWGLSLNAINLTIGAGIFVLPAIVAEKLGSAGFMAYLFCAVLIILIMFCFAEVGSKISNSGGAYAYVDAAFGSYASFIINTLLWLGYSIMSDAAIANALFDLIKNLHPVFSFPLSKLFFFLIIFSFFSYINIKGVKSGSRFVGLITILKIIPLVLLIIFGLFHISANNLAIDSFPKFKAIGETSLILLFAFFGSETALNISGEIKQPNKTIPKAIFISIAVVVIIYLLLQFVAQGVLGNDLKTHQYAPLLFLAERLLGPLGGTLIFCASIISMFSLLSGDVLASPRILFAAAEKKLLPNFLKKLHPTFATPYWSIIVYSFLVVVFSVTGTFKSLAILASSSILIIYLAVVLSVIKLRKQNSEITVTTFKTPFGLMVPILSIIVICCFLFNSTMDEFKTLLIFIIGVSTYYFFNKWFRQSKKISTK